MSKAEQGIGALLLTALIILSGAGIMLIPIVLAQELPDPGTIILVDSPFKLWNSQEKALDKNFSVVIFMPIASNNSTNNYIIRVNNNYTNGSFGNYHRQSYLLVNVSKIEVLEVTVNNQSQLLAFNVRVMSGITQSQIDQGGKPYMISLLPTEWTRREWGIFWSIIASALICCLIAYRMVMRYRKARGVIELK